MSFTLSTPQQIATAQLLALASGLALEINTGLKMGRGRSPLTIARTTVVTIGDEPERYITSKRTKAGALADVVEVLKAVMPEGWQPGPTVKRALDASLVHIKGANARDEYAAICDPALTKAHLTTVVSSATCPKCQEIDGKP